MPRAFGTTLAQFKGGSAAGVSPGLLSLLGHVTFLYWQSIRSHRIKVQTRAIAHEMSEPFTFVALGWPISTA